MAKRKKQEAGSASQGRNQEKDRYLYYVDKKGNVVATKMNRGQEKKK